jgi:hypothetical protein
MGSHDDPFNVGTIGRLRRSVPSGLLASLDLDLALGCRIRSEKGGVGISDMILCPTTTNTERRVRQPLWRPPR